MEHTSTSEEEDEEIVDIRDSGGEQDVGEGEDGPAAGSSGDDAEDQEDGEGRSKEFGLTPS